MSEINSMIWNDLVGELTTEKDLESMIGKLNHAAIVVSEGNHFINRLRYQLKMIKLNRRQHGRLHPSEIKDLQLWISMLNFLKEGNIGRSYNHVLWTIPWILWNRSRRLLHYRKLGLRLAFWITQRTERHIFNKPTRIPRMLLDRTDGSWIKKTIQDSFQWRIAQTRYTGWERINTTQSYSHSTMKFPEPLESSGWKPILQMNECTSQEKETSSAIL